MDLQSQPRSATTAVIIEWENALNSEATRAFQAMDALNRELNDCPARFTPIEVILAVNPQRVTPDALRQELAQHLIPVDERYSWRVQELAGHDYYGLKNAGAALTSAGIVIFLDSDVIPQPHWLIHLLEAFEDPSIQVVGGTTFIDHSDQRIYSKAFALGWFLDPPPTTRELLETGRVWANNIAFRRTVLERFQFIEIPRTARGGDSVLIGQLLKANIPVHRSTAAITSHPAPLPPNFIRRAIVQGRDDFTITGALRRANLPTVRRTSVQSRIAHKLDQLSRNWRAVGLKPLELPLAFTILFAYYSFYAIGYFGIQVIPGWFNRLKL